MTLKRPGKPIKTIIIKPEDHRPLQYRRTDKIIAFIEKNNGVTGMQIMRELKVSEATIRRDLQRLLDNRMIWRERCKCGQGWLHTREPIEQKKTR